MKNEPISIPFSLPIALTEADVTPTSDLTLQSCSVVPDRGGGIPTTTACSSRRSLGQGGGTINAIVLEEADGAGGRVKGRRVESSLNDSEIGFRAGNPEVRDLSG